MHKEVVEKVIKNKKTILYIITTVSIAVVIVTHLEFIIGCISKLGSVVEPFIYGAALAWLLTPLCAKIEKTMNKHSKKKKGITVKSIIITETIFMLLIISVIFIIGPNLLESGTNIINSLPATWESTKVVLADVLGDYEWASETIINDFEEIEEGIKDYITTIVKDNGEELVTGIYLGTKQTVIYIFDIVCAVIISIFILYHRKEFAKQAKCILYALFKPNIVKFIIDELKVANEKFSGFFAGKIVDSIIIGIACFIILWIMRMPYTAMVALIVGITNIIPIVGPFIGAIPSAIIIFSVSPIKSLYFIIFIIILQQLDGHIIGPKCIGSKIGLNTFWVLFAIIFFGRLLGIIGMVIGVPLFAVIYDMTKKFVSLRLKKKNIIAG